MEKEAGKRRSVASGQTPSLQGEPGGIRHGEASSLSTRNTKDAESRISALEKRLLSVNTTQMIFDMNAIKRIVGDDLGQIPQFDPADCSFMMMCFVFCFMMTLPGLALFYGGLVRVTNVLSIVMQTFCIACLITLLWVIIGYSLSFSPGSPLYGDARNFWLQNVTRTSYHELAPKVPEAVFVLFQLSFAIITPAVICGSFADRMRLAPMLVFMTLWHLLVYCPMVHSMWTHQGFLYRMGILDFAGGNVVHVAAGFSGLVSSLVVGKRKGFAQGKTKFAAHNMLLSVMGASILWVGWFSFNAGTAGQVGAQAAQAVLNTHIGASTGSLAWMSTEWVLRRRPSVFAIISGALAGLIAVTPGAGYMDHTGAFVAGFGAGALCYWTCQLKDILMFDDALDAFGIHGPAAIYGGIVVGFFANDEIGGTGDDDHPIRGCLFGNCRQVGLQILGIVVSIAWSSVITFVILKAVDAAMGLRVDESAELIGLDIVQHGEKLGTASNNVSQSGMPQSEDDWHQQEINASQRMRREDAEDWHRSTYSDEDAKSSRRSMSEEGPSRGTELYSGNTRDAVPAQERTDAANLGTCRAEAAADSMAPADSPSAPPESLAGPASNGHADKEREAGAASKVWGREKELQEGQGEREWLQDCGDVAAPDGICIDTGHA